LVIGSLIGWFIGSFLYPVPQSFVFGGIVGPEKWRLISPIFVHFGLMHFVFNGLWLCLLGARIERLSGSLHLVLVVLLCALVSNMGQYVWSSSVYFGGMSGVIYGLLGYIWIRNLMAPHPLIALPKELILFMIGWLFVCMTGILDILLGVGIANAAHASGLMIGMLLGLVFGVVAQIGKRIK
jgi:GlpG protein